MLYEAERGNIIRALAQFSFAKAEAMELVPEHTSRALNREFEDKLAITVMRRCISNLFLPAPITTALALLHSSRISPRCSMNMTEPAVAKSDVYKRQGPPSRRSAN